MTPTSLFRNWTLALAAGLLVSLSTGRLQCAGAPPTASEAWTADNGNGTYSNPLFYEEFEDPDVIRVGKDYYLAGTTMHMNPAVQLMRSRDLVNWELVGYCADRLDFGPAFRLEGGNIYGQGIWAPCIRYHQGMFYVFTNVNGVGLLVFRSKSIDGPWERNQLPGRHDSSVLFDDDGRVYIISGARSPYPIEELAPDLKSFVPGVRHQLNGQMGEGHHLYKINGKYVDVSAIPGGPVDQMVAIADSLEGPWKIERMVQGESLGVTAAAPDLAGPNDRGLWLHQGGIVDTPSGQWWSIIMSDHGSAGRMVSLVPVTWHEGFPLIGLPGNLRKAPNTWIHPDTGFVQEPKPAFDHDDSFDGGHLNPHWQWNHVPDDSKWSVTEKPGTLRLHSLPAEDFYSARNSLCQRPPGPESVITVEMDASGLLAGDTAGLALLSSPYAWIGVSKTAEGARLEMLDSTRGPRGDATPPSSPHNAPTVASTPPPDRLWLRVHCNFDNDQAVFSWSADGREFAALGKPFTMTFQLRTFQGVRLALFHYNTSGRPGGCADFDQFTVEEPRARNSERAIPLGKTITLASGADGSLLAADAQDSILVNLQADSPDAGGEGTRFQVVDLGLGRVALKTAGGRFVSANADAVVLKDLCNAPPGEAESFQWINLMRGDTMLMSLGNHRYVAVVPDRPGPVTVSAVGPRPDRKGGACFRWKQCVLPAAGSNPIVRDVFTADPAPLVVDDTVYVYAGHDAAKEDEMFTMPEWLCYSSKDMQHWTAHGPVLKPTDFSWGEPNSAWAAQVVPRMGKYFYFVTVKGDRTAPGNNIGVAVADSPVGPFQDAIGKPLVRDAMTPGARRPWEDIDPTVWIDEEGTPWMAWGNTDCYLAKLNPNMVELQGTIQKIDLPYYVEAPWLCKRGKLYYLVYAAIAPPVGSEQVAYATAEKITGPWTYRGIVTGPAKHSFTIHPGMIEFKGQWYFFYHFAGLTIHGQSGALGRRAVCGEYLHFSPDGSIQPIVQTAEGVSIPPRN